MLNRSPLVAPAVSPSESKWSSVWPLETLPLKANGERRLAPHWSPQSPKSPKSPKVQRLSPQESGYLLAHTHALKECKNDSVK